MPKYAYVATAPDGSTMQGVQRADNRLAVESALAERNLRHVDVTEKKSVLQFEITGARVKRDDLMHLSRQMGAFVRAGLPILQAVQTIAAESTNPTVRRVMTDIEEGLRAGDRFSDCIDRHRSVFPDYYRGIVRSAELTGELDVVLQRLSTYIERDLAARRKIKSATTYPAVVLVLSLVTVVVLSWFVLPKFKVFFASLHATLPLPTRMLMAVTDFLTARWWALGIGLLVLVGATCAILQTERGRYAKDRLALGVPVMGETIQYALVERFCRVLGSMVSAGVALPEALSVATQSARNRVFVRGLSTVIASVLEGQGLAAPLSRTGLFPPAASQMLRVGEETGTLDAQLQVTAEYYETELDHKIKKFTALFEPAVIVVMGLVVGFVAIALVSAMYGVFHQVDV